MTRSTGRLNFSIPQASNDKLGALASDRLGDGNPNLAVEHVPVSGDSSRLVHVGVVVIKVGGQV
jgi:hypothetical protein